MRITESRLRRIIRSVIAEGVPKQSSSLIGESSSYIGELLNKRCQDYYKNPYDDPEDPEPNTYVDNYDYYGKIKDIFTIRDMEASLADSVDKLGLTNKLGGVGSKNLLFINKLYQSLDPKLPRDENLNTLLGFIIDISA